ncbi:MAG: aminotransferase class I/II-fold pyridoxal phosphate-dependent enzyme [Firmicutes bacterium]|nr:aminotransferase class I/II-fold pyridoxal phosphate-dependent enzyme [Bacillota bacterium]
MISKIARSLTPYTAGEQPQGGFVKLNTNENPYPPAPCVREVLHSFDAKKLRLYPDPDSKALTRAIAEFEGVAPENVFLGNGSDEVLAFAFRALFEDSVAYPDVTYSFYPVYCDLFGLTKKIIPLKDDFSIDFAPYKTTAAGGIVIANPNAPTSVAAGNDAILDLVGSVSCNVLVDEAYIDFSGQGSLARRALSYKNLLVVKTFSKSRSLAGLRCGYAVGSKELIDGLNRVKNCFNSYTLSRLTQEAALASISDSTYFDEKIKAIVATRERTAAALKKAGHTVLPSGANFLFVRHKSLGGEAVYKYLKENGVLVRYFASARTAPFVRVTVGTDADMETFLKLMR